MDLRRGLATVERSKWQGHVTETKGMECRTVPMTQRLKRALTSHRHRRGERVLSTDAGETSTAKAVQRWMAKVRRVAGLRATGAIHLLRHVLLAPRHAGERRRSRHRERRSRHGPRRSRQPVARSRHGRCRCARGFASQQSDLPDARPPSSHRPSRFYSNLDAATPPFPAENGGCRPRSWSTARCRSRSVGENTPPGGAGGDVAGGRATSMPLRRVEG